MLIVALPPLRVTAPEEYVPLVRVTEPVGVGLLLPPVTATITDNACVAVMLDEPGVTVTVGVIKAGDVTVTVFDPVALLYVEELEESAV
jgi:hypothetical protein